MVLQNSNQNAHPVNSGDCNEMSDEQVTFKQVSENRLKIRGSSTLKCDKLRRRQTLKQVIMARQEKIYAQQCEIDELRQRIRAVCTDNKFLREQNYWQAKALEKLDGKHAELPQIINSHLEEIRVFREQIRRMKAVLKLEKHRRQEAESANDKALAELRHLRKLAEQQNLLEREELMQTIEKLQRETAERGKLLTNLERYAENLEKNQRFESMRHTKSQKELRETCQNLLDRIQALEQTVQEKQKIIELGHIYSNRFWRQQPMKRKNAQPFCSESTEAFHSEPEAVGQAASEIKTRSESNQKDSADERLKPKKLIETGQLGKAATTQVPASKNHGSEVKKVEDMPKGVSQREMNSTHEATREAIVLPKINQNHRTCGSKRYSSYTRDNKQVRFSATAPPVLMHGGELLFRDLCVKECEARLCAEEQLRRERGNESDVGDTNTMHENKEKTVKSDVLPMGHNLRRLPVIKINQPTAMLELERSEFELERYPVYTVDMDQGENNVEENAVSSVPLGMNSPRTSMTPSDLSTYGSSTIIPLQATIDHICRPCGDQDIDEFFTADTSGGSSSDSTDEADMWQDTPTNAQSSSGNSRLQRPLVSAPKGLEVNCVTQPALKDGPTKSGDKPPVSKTHLPVISCAVKTKTLYTMARNRMSRSGDRSK